MEVPSARDQDTEPSPSTTPARWDPILNSPKGFAQIVKTRLSAGLDGLDENDLNLNVLEDFLEVSSWQSVKSSELDSVKDTLILEGLLDELLNAILTSEPFWACKNGVLACSEDSVRESILYDITLLVRYAIDSSCDQVDASIGALAIRERRRLSQFLRDVWYNYQKILNSNQHEHLEEDLVVTLLAFSTQLESLYHVEERPDSLLNSSYEIGLLILNLWTRLTGNDPHWSFFELVTEGLDISETRDAWTKAVRTFMNDARRTEKLIDKCVDCLAAGAVINSELADILNFVDPLVVICPRSIFRGLYNTWIHLLFGMSRACERQLCNGSDWISNEMVLPAGLTITHALLFDQHMTAIYADTEQMFARMDLVSIIASYSVYAVTEGPEYLIGYMQKMLCIYQAMPTTYAERLDHAGLSVLIETAGRRVPEVIRALSQVPETSDEVKGRKRALLGTWKRYQKAVRLDDVAMVNASKESLASIPAWTTCAAKSCCCHRKKPCHALRVCKGCWQTYYCSAKCQKADWRQGGHSGLCSRLREELDGGI